EHNRVRVRFHWDRTPAAGAAVYCRVAQGWTGNSFGAWYLPRVSQEVVVGFEEGDPDRPVVLGSVYRGNAAPPFDPAESKTVGGLKTRSTRDPDQSHYHELSFEDAAGREQIRMVSQGDFNVHVKRHEHTVVDGDRSGFVGGNLVDR